MFYVKSSNIVINFNIGYYDTGVLVMNRKSIAKNYMQTSFLRDFITNIPVFMILTGTRTEYDKDYILSLISALKLIRFTRLSIFEKKVFFRLLIISLSSYLI